ncbi:MAG: glycerol dehydrogenase [Synergistaceae bacterium]|jgi:glycerol dehydrogenase|nr:glycerol dehydrogenase [Synergistaceae bacterium]
MKKALLLPRKYVQGRGIVSEIGPYAAMLGKKAVVTWGGKTKAAVGEAVLNSLEAAGVEYVDDHFNGECTKAEARRIADAARGSDMVIGLGGGKAIDTAKGAAIFAKLPHIIVPTVASNDSPTSACSVWYDDEGVCVGFDLWPCNPDYILVDTEVIAKAPLRLFIAGIGDAMSTWFETEASFASRAVTCSGGAPTMTVMAMAKLCFEILMEYGFAAIEAVKVHAVTPAVEKVIEATTLLSGVGWESGGLTTAHQIANALPALHETHACLHGEKVTFGLMTQLCLDDSLSSALIDATAVFLAKAGLPVTFAGINIDGVSEERLRAFANGIVGEGSFVNNHNFTASGGDIYDAMKAADALGKRIKATLE